MTQLSMAERDDLVAAARKLLDARCRIEDVRVHMAGEAGYDPALWAELVGLGWLAIHVPSEHGGMGGSFVDFALVLHELGRHLAPAPVLGSAVLGVDALVHGDNDAQRAEWLPAVLAGERLLAVSLCNTRGSYELAQGTLRWERAGASGVRLDGEARFVPDGARADGLVVAARDQAGAAVLVLVEPAMPGVTVATEATTDPTRRLARLTLDGVVVADSALLAEPAAAVALHERLVSLGALAVAADGVGAAERVLEITTAYARERRQFDRPIGSFQAVKHHCANMLIDVEGSRAAVAQAAEAADGAPGGLHPAASVAAAHAGPACARACQTAIQVHGGIGFTWEYDAHLFLKRAKLDEAMFGDPGWHRRRLARHVRQLAAPAPHQ